LLCPFDETNGDGGEVSLQEDHDVGVPQPAIGGCHIEVDAAQKFHDWKSHLKPSLYWNHLAFTLDEMREYLIVIVVLCKIPSFGDGCKVVDKVLSHIARPDY
jgi:hypothetical protein